MNGERQKAAREAGESMLRRATAWLVKALSDLLEASEPKRRRPRNLYIKGVTANGLVTRPYSE